jgi:membrane protein implicated in regulation of membrane protease activity
MWFLLLLLLVLVLTGALWLVVKIALAVALGVFLGLAAVIAVVWWRVRRALLGGNSRWRRVPGSQVTVRYRSDPPD